MEYNRHYRQLTEAEKRYIDTLVNEEWGEAIGQLGNKIKQGFNSFHNKFGGGANTNANANNGTNTNSGNLGYINTYFPSSINKEDNMPTERSQTSQFFDFIGDLVTNGKHSQEKNNALNAKMQKDLQLKGNDPYWENKILRYWSYYYKKNVPGEQAANDFIKYVRMVSGNKNYFNQELYNYVAQSYGKQKVNPKQNTQTPNRKI
jgi:hypothetical protein